MGTKIKLTIIAIGLLAAIFGGVAPARAVWQSQLALAALTLEQAASKVQAKAGGRILGADTARTGGGDVYIIRVLSPDGSRVRHFSVDPKSGKIDAQGER